ncbi:MULTISPECIES: 5'/3'-nucleotidase SurE [unclassified Beijerinckia]|uniref:5'/3'-nucleotidase SurE n=1 Tax=unclassified Beijerinckia TaxID=2638183 RepID=UPI00089C2979|nr:MULTISPECIES: 5'/3'-nucleotidase SurE [unclassified Beijerinckia]MDH7795587.1 5'-nucleotidase [Beijerinckia sp. GAS462]SEC07802.1 5'-nucleotidase /3'-nucleotidase /exopolyphosphatase [Beijerinckia sp. 28-YEA-48]
MHILITNDDGIHAPGLKVLEGIAGQLGASRITVVAPEADQSGVAHSLSLNDPLRLREVTPSHFAVQGTPTDCVIMAIHKILEGARPDLVLSGVNAGHNVAEDVTYSGTVAGAMEAAILGIPAIALSQSFPAGARDMIPWDNVETHAPDVLRRLIELGIPLGTLINVNFPRCSASEVRGISVCSQGKRDAALLRVEERLDGRHRPYYWIGFQRQTSAPAAGSDLAALADNRISITPLRIDLTDREAMQKYAGAFA